MKLEVTKEKVREAAQNCPAAKETLKILFPEAFDIYLNLSKLNEEGNRIMLPCGQTLIELRGYGNLSGKALYLSTAYSWEIVVDSTGTKCLVPNYIR